MSGINLICLSVNTREYLFFQNFVKLNRQRKALYKDGVSRFIFRYYLSRLKNKSMISKTSLRKRKKKREENINEMDKI